MSLSMIDVDMIVDAIKPIITEPLKDVTTSHQMAVQLIRDTLTKLEECRLQLNSMTVDLGRANHHVIDADTSIGISRDLARIYKKRISELETMLEQKQAEIVELRQQLNG